jgi:hypothetical protein
MTKHQTSAVSADRCIPGVVPQSGIGVILGYSR